jgi:outer membrane protein TolC
MSRLISLLLLFSTIFFFFGCSPSQRLAAVDRSARDHIAAQQQAGLGKEQPFSVTPAADQLRRRLLVEQQLPVVGPASFSSAELEPVPHWPGQTLPGPPPSLDSPLPGPVDREIRLSLEQALQIAAQNSRAYQEQKENLYRSALALDFERHGFAWQASGSAEGRYRQDRGSAADTTEGTALSLVGGLARSLTNGISLTTQLGWDLVRMLAPAGISSSGLYGDASLTIPLLRGSGRHIVAEPLTQAERNVLYAVWQFERFKQTFVVELASRYLAALQSADLLRNQAENYRSLIVASRRARRLAEAGKLPLIQVDQAQQNELRARDRWVAARQARVRSLDEIRNLLGLPPDARVTLERTELKRLAEQINQRLPNLFTTGAVDRSGPADAPVALKPPDPTEAGPLEIGSAQAIRLALANRLDLRIGQEQVTDAQRRVVVAADALRAELTLLGTAATGSGRSIAPNQPADSNRLDFDAGTYSTLLTLDLPFDRRREAIGLRTAYLDLEAAMRSVQELEDRVKLEVRSDLRTLEQARASLKVQDRAVKLAERRVRGTQLELQAGRSEIRDLLDAREDQLSARNALTAAMVAYRLAELELQRDLGVLEVDNNGLWQEFSLELQDERG